MFTVNVTDAPVANLNKPITKRNAWCCVVDYTLPGTPTCVTRVKCTITSVDLSGFTIYISFMSHRKVFAVVVSQAPITNLNKVISKLDKRGTSALWAKSGQASTVLFVNCAIWYYVPTTVYTLTPRHGRCAITTCLGANTTPMSVVGIGGRASSSFLVTYAICYCVLATVFARIYS
jgi:hypothetical protein